MTTILTEPSEAPELCVAAIDDEPSALDMASPLVVELCGLIVNMFVGLSNVFGIPYGLYPYEVTPK